MFPTQRFTIHSSLSPELVRQKLLDIVQPPGKNRWNRRNPEKPYEGEVGEHSFQIIRIINYRNSFLPVIKGRITPEGMGSQIDIEMTLHPFVFIFMLIWLGMVGQMGILFLVATIAEGTFEPAALVPVAMFIFGCLLTVLGFKPEADRTQKFLQHLLES